MLKYSLFALIFLLGFGKFIPLYYCPSFLQSFFSNWALFLHIPAIIVLLLVSIILIKNKGNKIEIIAVGCLYMVLWLLSPQLQELNNKIVIKVNEGKSQSDFFSPVLGMKIIKSNLENNQTLFKFNQGFGTYEALIFKQNHGLNPDVYEVMNEVSFKKVYNRDWYWYVHLD